MREEVPYVSHDLNATAIGTTDGDGNNDGSTRVSASQWKKTAVVPIRRWLLGALPASVGFTLRVVISMIGLLALVLFGQSSL